MLTGLGIVLNSRSRLVELFVEDQRRQHFDNRAEFLFKHLKLRDGVTCLQNQETLDDFVQEENPSFYEFQELAFLYEVVISKEVERITCVQSVVI
jgi:hypothetical protein